jgi:hypothetical protein
MNSHASVPAESARLPLTKADPTLPALIVLDRTSIAIRAGTVFNGRSFDCDTPIAEPEGGYEAGADYAVMVDDDGAPFVQKLTGIPTDPRVLGGFHFAPGGNAKARAGGNKTPASNPYSCWDSNYRPTCPDPRGMTLVDMPNGKWFWCDIYLLGIGHLVDGTSRFDVTIADGDDLPGNPKGRKFKRFDYEAARAVYDHHGKGLLSFEEFAWAAIGVTEKSAREGDPKITSLDAARTSRVGVMQATGNLWVWGHDGDPDDPRPSMFGGSWLDGSLAGSRYAALGSWPGHSGGDLGARGRSDHLQLG